MNYESEITLEDIEAGILEMTLEDIRYAIIDGYVIDVKNELEAFKQLRHTLLHLDIITYNEINKILMELSDEFTFETIGIDDIYEKGLFESKKLGIYAVNKEIYEYKCYNMNSIPELLNVFAVYDELIDLLFEKFDEYTEDIFISAKNRFEELFRKNII